MKKDDFYKKIDIMSSFFDFYGLIEEKISVFRLDFFPDFDLTEYDRDNRQNYYFHNSISYERLLSYVIEAKIIENHIVQIDIPNIRNSIIEVTPKERIEIESQSFGDEINSFKLNNVKVIGNNDIEKTLLYEGGFASLPEDFGNDLFNIYSLMKIKGVSKEIGSKTFYLQLFVESYCLYKSENYKMSFFILFTGFDSFINYSLKRCETKENKKCIKEKINELFSEYIDDLQKNQIYSSIRLTEYEKIRDDIAHGKCQVDMEESFLLKAFSDVFVLVLAYNQKCQTYEELLSKLKKA